MPPLHAVLWKSHMTFMLQTGEHLFQEIYLLKAWLVFIMPCSPTHQLHVTFWLCSRILPTQFEISTPAYNYKLILLVELDWSDVIYSVSVLNQQKKAEIRCKQCFPSLITRGTCWDHPKQRRHVCDAFSDSLWTECYSVLSQWRTIVLWGGEEGDTHRYSSKIDLIYCLLQVSFLNLIFS